MSLYFDILKWWKVCTDITQPYYSECIKEFNLVLWISRFECTWILCFLKAEITVIFHHNIVTWRCGISLYLHGSILMRFVCNVILILVSSLNYCYFLHFPHINIFPHVDGYNLSIEIGLYFDIILHYIHNRYNLKCFIFHCQIIE